MDWQIGVDCTQLQSKIALTYDALAVLAYQRRN